MYPENPKGTQVIAGSMNMGYVAVVLNFTIASHMLIVESFRGLVWRCYAGRRDPPPVSEPVSTPQPGLTLCFLFPIDRWKLRPFQHPKNWPPFSGRSRGGGLGAPPHWGPGASLLHFSPDALSIHCGPGASPVLLKQNTLFAIAFTPHFRSKFQTT